MAVSSDTLRLAIVEEAVEGETPATPTFMLMRTTGEGLVLDVETTNSEEMGGLNRGVKDNILAGAAVSGEISFELSKHDALEELMASVLGNTWAGDPLSVPGAGADKTYNASVLRTFTAEKRLTLDDAPTYRYHRFTGCMTDVMNLSITPNEPITGNFAFIGQQMLLDGSELPGATYESAGTNPIMTAPLVSGIELLEPEGIDDTTGLPLGVPAPWMVTTCVTDLDLALENNGRGIQCIGHLGNKEVVFGQFNGTASGTMLYSGDDPLEALIDRTEYMLRVTCEDDDGGTLVFLFPRVVFAEASAPATGTNTDIEVPFTMTILEYQGDDYAVSAIFERSTPAGAMLSGATDAANGQTESTGSVTTDIGAGTLWAVVTQSSTTPTHAQIVGGSDHTSTVADWSGNQAVSASGVQTLSPAPSGLTAATAYWTHFTQYDGVVESVPVTAAGFTTDA